MLIPDLIGYIGMFLVLISMYLVRKHYSLSQFFFANASAVMWIYAYLIGSIPMCLLNLVGIIISFNNLMRHRRS